MIPATQPPDAATTRFPNLVDDILTEGVLSNIFEDFVDAVEGWQKWTHNRQHHKFETILAQGVNKYKQALDRQAKEYDKQLRERDARCEEVKLASATQAKDYENQLRRLEAGYEKALRDRDARHENMKLVLAAKSLVLVEREAQLKHYWGDELDVKSRTEFWTEQVAKGVIEDTARPLNVRGVLSVACTKMAKRIADSEDIVAEEDSYAPIKNLLTKALGKTSMVFDTHNNDYLNKKKPDLTVSLPVIKSPHAAYVRTLVDMKARNVKLDNDGRGHVLGYLYNVAKVQTSRTRFTGLLSNIDENIFIVVVRSDTGRFRAWCHAPVSFEQAMAHIKDIANDPLETPFNPKFSWELGNIRQHLGTTPQSVVAEFALPSPDAVRSQKWKWANAVTGEPSGTVCVKRVSKAANDFAKEIKMLQKIAEQGGHERLPQLVFHQSDNREYGMLPVGCPIIPAVFNRNPTLARAVLSDVWDALGWLHGHGIVHRDVRWDNIVTHNDRGVLIDIGSAIEATKPSPAMNEAYYATPADDHHAFILLVNTLMFPQCVYQFNSGNVAHKNSTENKALRKLWKALRDSDCWGPYVTAAEGGDKKKLRKLIELILTVDASMQDLLSSALSDGVTDDSPDAPATAELVGTDNLIKAAGLVGKHNQMGNKNLKELSDSLGLDVATVREKLERHFLDNERWLLERANHSKWIPARVDSLIETKTITSDAWFNKAIELGVKLGVDTANIEQAALHSLHILQKKKVDEKLAVQQKQINAAAKKLHAERGLAAANTRVDAADQEMAAAEIRTEGATLEASAAHTRVDAADQEMAVAEIRTEGATLEALAGQTRSAAADLETQLIKHRTDGALLEGEAGDLRYQAAKGEEEIIALRRNAAKKEDEAASLRLQREKDEKEAASRRLQDEEERAAIRLEREKVRLARERLLLEQEATSGSGRSSRGRGVPGPQTASRGRGVPGPQTASRRRGVPAPGRSTTQARGASGSSTEVADEQDAVEPPRRRLDALRISGDPIKNPVRKRGR
ncbi:hypothetical protein FN846DRAFT_913285 [Sphaerosporella brunnea]|uniref:Protein kinase domain-containing protein n=1 Tax=Sphaerosporella brunnea TaxID=1250544 RepID=A0A5J5EGL3_9PEZI|nr:hypothetical protein FN846DRAFT_913285 [Sphaerosporella brunnea]